MAGSAWGQAAVFLDEALRSWLRSRDTNEALQMLKDADVVASRIYSVKDMLDDPVFQWRENIVSVEDAELGPVRMQSVFPKLQNHGGMVWRTGPALGEDNDLVLREWLGMDDTELLELRKQKVI